jgi:signal transduction histidine kinase
MDRPAELEFTWLMFTGISLMFLLAMSLVLFFVYYQRRLYKQQVALERQQLEEQKKLLQAEITAQEKERARIAIDLHDEVGALLSTIKLYITAGQVSPALPDAHKNQVETMLDDAVQKLRAISQNLLPQNLQLFGLTSAIEYHCQQLLATGVFEIHFHHCLYQRMNEGQELMVYRIIQELLNNTSKHAAATLVIIELHQLPDSYCLSYTDNGIGFVLEEIRNPYGLGMSALNSRVQMLNGDMKLLTSPNQGVRITITFPYINLT